MADVVRSDCPQKEYHGNPFRYCPCGWAEEPQRSVFDGSDTAPTDLASAVYQTVGAGSMCWEHPEGAGTFLSDKAKKHADDLIAWVNEHYQPRQEEAIICPACARMSATPLNYPQHPSTKDHWRCGLCGHIFEAKEHD